MQRLRKFVSFFDYPIFLEQIIRFFLEPKPKPSQAAVAPFLYLEEVGFCRPFNLSHGHVQFLNTQNDKLSIDNFKKLSPPSDI